MTVSGEQDLRLGANRLVAPRTVPLADDELLAAALSEGHISVLLQTYVHLTHDEAILDRFAPHLKAAIQQRPEDVPTPLADDLRDRLRDVLTGRSPVVDEPPSTALYQKMMSVGVGEPVSGEFLPLLFDQIGLPVAEVSPRHRSTPMTREFTVLVIGLGLTGIAATIKLMEAGYRVIAVEKNDDIGGTWLLNTYPGVGVDTPSHFYSYSFAQWPHWSNYKPKGDEMQRYFAAVVEHYEIRQLARFSTTVDSCVYDETDHIWHVTLRAIDGTSEQIEVQAIVNAGGFVHRARMPDIDGLEEFAGPALHTARWDRSVDLRGKRVGVIGTGASGVQVVPAIAPDAAHVTVFMRRRYWVLNNRETDVAVSPGVRYAIERIPHYREWLRFRVYWIAGDGNYQKVLLDPIWAGNDLAVSQQNEDLRQFALAQMQTELAERPDLLEKVTPDFPIFSKRIISHPDWWTTLKRDDVTLVTEAIDRVLPRGIQTTDGTIHDLDALVLATGFDFARMHGGLDVVGRAERRLADEWGDDDPRAYMGLMIPCFPNYFHMNGPNSGPNFAGGVNIIAETQAHYIVACLDWTRANDADALEPTQQAFIDWNVMVDEQLTKMIWSHPRSDSYYQNSKRRPYMSWPFRLIDYWNHTRRPVDTDFALHRSCSDAMAGPRARS
jgi:4-hydroxyacetophenone monooxygenase